MNFGTTPWGKLFLDALTSHYYADPKRLNRGKIYAKQGNVKSINIKDGKIYAKIQGQRLYKAYIHFTPFDDDSTKKIKDIININPSFLADITNGYLSEEFLEKIKEEKIDIFPKDWDTLKRDCSCPDWGDPCKHIAALYFIIINEIDKNPFLIFEIRGLDLKREFKIKNIVEITPPIYLSTTKNIPHLSRVDFEYTEKNDYLPFIISMLPQKVPYLTKDFRELHLEFYKYFRREAIFRLSPLFPEENDVWEQVFKESEIDFIPFIKNPCFAIKSKFIKKLKGRDTKNWLYDQDQLLLGVVETAKIFLSFKSSRGSDSYYYLFNLFSFIYNVIKENAYIFDVTVYEQKYRTILKPLGCLEELNKKLEILYSFTPQILKLDTLKKGEYFTQKSQTDFIISSILSNLANEINFVPAKGKEQDKKLSNIIFSCKEIPLSTFFGATLARSIDNSYEIFNIKNAPFLPKLMIDSQNNKDYFLKIFIDDKLLNQALKYSNKIEILKYLNLFKPLLEEIDKLKEYEIVELKKERLKEFLTYSKEFLLNLGFQIILPKELMTLLRPKPILKASKKLKSGSISFLNLNNLLDFDYKVMLGDYELSLEEFKRLVSKKSDFIKFKEHFVIIDPKEAEKIISLDTEKPKFSKFDILAEILSQNIIFDPLTKEEIDKLFIPKNIDMPKLLNAELRQYQKSGIEWSINNLLNGFGVVLADDMGLGKTVQAIAVILYLKEIEQLRNGVVVVPTTLLNNWEAELKKFAPSLSYSIYYGSKRKLDNRKDLIITTYQIITRDIAKFKELDIDLLIIDEAQNIKNIDAKTTKSMNTLKSKYKIALSGTPVENNLSELWSIFNFSFPGFLGTHNDFSNRYAKPIQVYKDISSSEALKKITAPFMLRRLKTDKNIISDLPEKIVIDELASMTPEQVALYKATVDETTDKLNMDENLKGEIFKLITSLKQICNHPRNFDKTSPISPLLSGKAQLLLTILSTILEREEKVLIFTQYTEMADILMEMIENEFKTTPLYLHGRLSKVKRDNVVAEFKNKQEKKIFILSLKAAGVGLNLTEANHVIHYDLWFNPAVENQATDRAFRIGQDKNVTVHRLITKNSFEEKIDAIIKSKKELADLTVSIGENWLSNLSKDEVLDIFKI